MVKFFYIDNEEYKPMSIRSTTFGGETSERYELDTNERYELDTIEVDVIIDSGADAPIFSSSMIHCGRQCDGQQVALQDAQGRAIPLLGQRSVAVVLEDKNGVEIEVRDNVVFSDEISQPILSFGRLMNAGWSMCAQTRSLRNGAYEICWTSTSSKPSVKNVQSRSQPLHRVVNARDEGEILVLVAQVNSQPSVFHLDAIQRHCPRRLAILEWGLPSKLESLEAALQSFEHVLERSSCCSGSYGLWCRTR